MHMTVDEGVGSSDRTLEPPVAFPSRFSLNSPDYGNMLLYLSELYTSSVFFLLHVSYMLQSTLKRESICCQLKIDSMLIRNALFSKLFFRIWFPSSLCFTRSMCNSLEIKKCKFLCVCVYVAYIYVCVFTCVWDVKLTMGVFLSFALLYLLR